MKMETDVWLVMRLEKMKEFLFPENGIASVKLSDMVKVLPHRASRSITKRLSGILKFHLTLSHYAMQTTFQTLIFYCVYCTLMFWMQLLTRNSCRLNRNHI